MFMTSQARKILVAGHFVFFRILLFYQHQCALMIWTEFRGGNYVSSRKSKRV